MKEMHTHTHQQLTRLDIRKKYELIENFRFYRLKIWIAKNILQVSELMNEMINKHDCHQNYMLKISIDLNCDFIQQKSFTGNPIRIDKYFCFAFFIDYFANVYVRVCSAGI